MHTLLKQARVSWEEESSSRDISDCSARSLDFDDLYFTGNFKREESHYLSSASDAVEHVFFKPNSLDQRFSQVKQFETINILETGFGSGLNFFLCFEKWKKRFKEGKGALRFISTELYPLSKKNFKKFGEHRKNIIDSIAFDYILKNYPPNIQGQYRFYFSKEQVELVLLFGDALSSLKDLDLKVDCIFLDGFSPGRNKELWSKELCAELGRLSKETTTLSSFTSAGWVRKNLENAGFKVEKTKGFPPKNHSLKAFRNSSTIIQKKPTSKLTLSRKAIIVGAGFSGCSLAYSLSKYGIESEILEKADDVAQGASGNKLAIAAPYLSNQQNFLNEFNFLSLEYFFNLISFLKEENKELEFYFPGALQLLSRRRLSRIFEEKYLENFPSDILENLNKQNIQDRFLLDSLTEGFYLKRAGFINPKDYCKALVSSASSKLVFNSKVKEIKKKKDTWLAMDADKNIIAESDFMILANAYSVNKFSQTSFLGLEPIRGQVTSFKTLKCLKNLSKILCFDGYLTPSINGQHFLGATYSHDDMETSVRESDNLEMLSSLKKYFPGLPVSELPKKEELLKNSRVSFRASTYDRAPFVGEIPGEENLFVSVGFGSRGLSTSSLAAEIVLEEIVSKIRGDRVSTFPQRIREKLSPARYFKSRKFRRITESSA